MKYSAPLAALAALALAVLVTTSVAEAQVACSNCNNGASGNCASGNCASGNCANGNCASNNCANGNRASGRCAGGRCYSGGQGRNGQGNAGHRRGVLAQNRAYRQGYGPMPMKAQFGYGYYRHAHPYGPTIMDHVAYNRASGYNWHGNYNYTQWGVPVALVVPPTAETHTEMGWGVSETRVYRNDHQFNGEYPGGAYVGQGGGVAGYPMFRNTPHHPSDTTQFGVYPVRAPWN